MSIPWGDEYPIVANQDLQLYDMLIKLWKATRQRHRMLGTKYWPRQHFLFEEGTIENLTDNGDGTITLTDSSKTWPFSPHKRWVGWTNPVTGNTFEPASYDVVLNINADDPRDVIHATITEQLSATEIVFSRAVLDDYITAGVLGSIDDLILTEYAFTREGGLSWAKRWPRRPNDNEYEHSTISVSDATSATDSRALWTTNQWAGKELMCLSADDGRLKRIAITGNTGDTLTFAEQAFTPAWDEYAIIDAAGVWLPSNERYRPFAWYAGIRESYGAHYPKDQRTLTQEPATTQEWEEPNIEDACETVLHTTNIFDNDVWTGFDNKCDSDHCFSPDFWKTPRAMQIIVMSLITSFVNLDRWADGYEGEAVPMWTVAELLYAIGLGLTLEASTYDVPSGHLAVTASPPKASMPCYYAVLDDDGDVLAQGGDGTLTSTYLAGGALSEVCAGKTVFISYGLPRYREKQFRYAYGKTVFIADYEFVPIDPDNPGLGNELVIYDPPEPKDPPPADPPDNFGIGSFQTRGKSTTTRGLDSLGMAADTSDAFVTGEYYRYVGDHWNDPSITPHERYQITETRLDGFAPDYPYYERFYRGLPRDAFRETLLRQHQGRATATTKYSITDSNQDWWVDWYGGGELRVESGTATSGSTTTLVDEDSIPDPFWEAASGRYVGFILEIDKTDDDGTITYKVPITAMDAGAGRLTFAAVDGLTVEDGDVYRIREPKYELNRWKGRTLRIKKPDNVVIDVVITHSDRTTLFFAAEDEAIPAKSSYEIIELQFGAVYKWDGSKMIPPTGADAVRAGVSSPANFHQNLFENSPTIEKLYGLYMKGDVNHMQVIDVLYRILNKLYKTPITAVWLSRADEATPETNHWFGEGPIGFDLGSAASADAAWQAGRANALDSWGPYEELNGIAPVAQESGHMFFSFFTSGEDDFDRIYAYAKVNPPTLLESATDFANYAKIDSDDPDEEATTTSNGLGGSDYYLRHFDANGDDVAFRAWSIWDSQGASDDAERRSTQLGSTVMPSSATIPSLPSNSNLDVVTGYFVSSGVAILDWSVDDSVYLDPP